MNVLDTTVRKYYIIYGGNGKARKQERSAKVVKPE
jgi:hypothetical protein